ncbi:hypothetical protein TRV_00743 [Trichophyton verrucosum HKI 0517]|uniref:Uncharacterized protein n=1 Tax=Trichophyton verrucosum (strain HKI 0517) TaxID=663202 RepID=D4D0Z7_TRIVH|nr:uncharacterized protein TRV_00743 [Trichophyton verrucosum HKI 0517]EFE44474.1 hypothetical protein TRV_00743 [Trichophyton verrucosum HKI 0517]
MDEHEQKGEGRGTAGEEQTRREAGSFASRCCFFFFASFFFFFVGGEEAPRRVSIQAAGRTDKQKTERQAETAARAHKGREAKRYLAKGLRFLAGFLAASSNEELHEGGQVGPHWVRAQVQRAKGQQAHPVCLFTAGLTSYGRRDGRIYEYIGRALDETDSMKRQSTTGARDEGRPTELSALRTLYIYRQTSSRHLTAQRPQEAKQKGTRKHIYKLNQGTHAFVDRAGPLSWLSSSVVHRDLHHVDRDGDGTILYRPLDQGLGNKKDEEGDEDGNLLEKR